MTCRMVERLFPRIKMNMMMHQRSISETYSIRLYLRVTFPDALDQGPENLQPLVKNPKSIPVTLAKLKNSVAFRRFKNLAKMLPSSLKLSRSKTSMGTQTQNQSKLATIPQPSNCTAAKKPGTNCCKNKSVSTKWK